MIKRMWDSFVAWLGKKLRQLFKMGKLKEEDITKRHFARISKQGAVRKYYRGDFILKWDSYNNRVTIRKGKALRHFSVVETPRELDWALNKIFS